MSYPKQFLDLLKPALDDSPQQHFQYEFSDIYKGTYYPLYHLFIVEHVYLDTMEMFQYLSHMDALCDIEDKGFKPCP